jgi:hypothetical protein
LLHSLPCNNETNIQTRNKATSKNFYTQELPQNRDSWSNCYELYLIKEVNTMFESESKMQEWLSEKLQEVDGIIDLVENEEEFEKYSPVNISEEKIYKSFEYCIKSLMTNTIVTENENISLKQGDSLKPDFILYAPETESMVIVELKNISGPTRQAGTELSAYASEIKTYVPFISDGDIVNVIISPVWPTLLRHFIFHEIFWLQRNIICLEPIVKNEVHRLKIIDIRSITEENISLKLSDRHLGGYQLCLYDDNLYHDPTNRTRLDPYLKQMRTALSAITTKGYIQKSHGFAFLWKDNWINSLAPYSITILNFAPFQSIERMFHDDNYKVDSITEKFINILVEHDPLGHGESLMAITKAGNEFLKGFCSPRTEGFMTWHDLKSIMNGRGDLKAFKCWGIFDELYSRMLIHEYSIGNLSISNTDPKLGLRMLDELIDPNYDFHNLSNYNYLPDEDSEYFSY